MEIKTESHPIQEFDFGEGPKRVLFIETMAVADGVECDVYTVEGDGSKDLGIIRIQGTKTPLQKVLSGDRTIEGYVSGKGQLTITKADGMEEIYFVREGLSAGFKIDVGVGESMQWEADNGSQLVAFEICIPPYSKGRFENIQE